MRDIELGIIGKKEKHSASLFCCLFFVSSVAYSVLGGLISKSEIGNHCIRNCKLCLQRGGTDKALEMGTVMLVVYKDN